MLHGPVEWPLGAIVRGQEPTVNDRAACSPSMPRAMTIAPKSVIGLVLECLGMRYVG
jgi:hypothetical protein